MIDVERRNLVDALAAYYGRESLSLVARAISLHVTELRSSTHSKETVEPQVEWLLDFGLLLAQTVIARRTAPAEDRLGTVVRQR